MTIKQNENLRSFKGNNCYQFSYSNVELTSDDIRFIWFEELRHEIHKKWK